MSDYTKDFIRLNFLSEIMCYNIVTDVTMFSDLPTKSYFVTPEKYHIVVSLKDGNTLQASDYRFDLAIDKIYELFQAHLNSNKN